MISPKCKKCGEELEDFGAIILSPPVGLQELLKDYPDINPRLIEQMFVLKDHLCQSCHEKLREWLNDTNS